MNDRELRSIVAGLGGRTGGVPREDGFEITAASEVMALFCLAKNSGDLQERLARIIVGQNASGGPVSAGSLKASGAMAALLKDALKPNLVQTLEHTPVFIHGGPFANIAHGCNSILATRMALALSDYVVTEAGFGADLGAEKFFNIKCRTAGLQPDAAVLVATVRALKYHGGVSKEMLGKEDLAALEKGFPNLLRHADNLRSGFCVPVTAAINRFTTDTDREVSLLQELCAKAGIRAVPCDVWARGGEGGKALAEEVINIIDGGKIGTG
jgi:formate--tetrahydrofolate ligase